MPVTRRAFIKATSLVSIGFLGLDRLAANTAFFSDTSGVDIGFGKLSHKAGDILSLPKGFTARIISQKGDSMDDGFFVPGLYDGMGAFALDKNRTLLIRNHEIGDQLNASPFGADNKLLAKLKPAQFYDFASGDRPCLGGTTTMVYNEALQKTELQYLSLTGTIRNCAGGITPWNSWITCEETSLSKGEGHQLAQSHGYNFEVPASTKIGLADPVPLKAMGRFVHEAVAVHPANGIVYQTEDLSDSAFYRFLPKQYGKLQQGGKLQCLAISEWKSADTRNWATESTDIFPQKKSFNVHWIDLDDVEAPDNDLRLRGHQKGAALFARTEGIWFGKNELFFACTSGGHDATGQIFRYVPSKYEGTSQEKESPATLELFLEPNNTEIFQNCDNLTVSPWGDVIICEDKRHARIIGISPEGNTYTLAENRGFPNSEFAGPVFSPSGKTMFVNIQSPGLTLAITGPWKT